MTSLPPKPQDSPSREESDSRPPPEERERRPARPAGPPQGGRNHRGRFNSPPPQDRFYVSRSPPRRVPIADSYVASSYEGRRDADFRRRDYGDRDRGSWDRPRDRESGQRYREPDSGYDYDRNRRAFERERPYERDRAYDRHRDQYGPYTRRGPSPRRGASPTIHSYSKGSTPQLPEDAPHRRSRSPQRKRLSPSPAYRRRSRSPAHLSPPPHKRMRLGNHCIDVALRHDYGRDSPPGPVRNSRGRSRSQSRRSRSRSPAHAKRETTSQTREVAKPEESKPLPQVEPSLKGLPTLGPGTSAPGSARSPTPLIRAEPTLHTDIKTEPTVLSPPHETLSDNHAEIEEELAPEVPEITTEIKPRDRSRSPPKEPRHHGPPPPPNLPLPASRSPPRGPRNHPRGNATPTGPASSHPHGPRGQRRLYLGPTALPAPSTYQNPPLASVEDQPTPMPEPEIKVLLPQIPTKKLPPSLTPELDAEVVRLQVHRAHLASEYTQLAKGNRRALHELDTSTIDLRAAELRRRVADIQYQKARNGVLGIDYVPTDTSVI